MMLKQKEPLTLPDAQAGRERPLLTRPCGGILTCLLAMATLLFSCQKDIHPPAIVINGPDVIKLPRGWDYVERGATAIDDEEGDISDRVVVSGSVDVNVRGTYFIHYTVEDKAGHVTTADRTIHVVWGYEDLLGEYVTDSFPCSYTMDDTILIAPPSPGYEGEVLEIQSIFRRPNGEEIGFLRMALEADSVRILPGQSFFLNQNIGIEGDGRMSEDGHELIMDYTFTPQQGPVEHCEVTYYR